MHILSHITGVTIDETYMYLGNDKIASQTAFPLLAPRRVMNYKQKRDNE